MIALVIAQPSSRDVGEVQDVGYAGETTPPWAGVTLTDLFVSTVQLNGAALAFAGGSSRDPRSPAALTYSQADEAIERVRHRIEDLGLPRNAVLLVCLGASVEAPVSILATLRAGLIPCLVPVTATRGELAAVIQASGAQGVLTCSAVGGLRPAEIVREASVEAGGPRYILAFGERLPAGVIPLGDAFQEAREAGMAETAPPPAASTLSVMTVELLPEGPALYVHDQEALVSLALELVLRGGLASGEAIVSTVSPMTQAGLVISMAPLLIGGALHLLPVFSGPALIELVEAAHTPHLVVPAALQPGLIESGMMGREKVSSTIVLHRPPIRFTAGENRRDWTSAVIDLVALGERTMIIGRRGQDGRPALTLADARIPDEDGALVLACRQDGALRLSVAGASVAARLNEPVPDRDTEWRIIPFAASLDAEGQIATLIRLSSPLSNYPTAVG